MVDAVEIAVAQKFIFPVYLSKEFLMVIDLYSESRCSSVVVLGELGKVRNTWFRIYKQGCWG